MREKDGALLSIVLNDSTVDQRTTEALLPAVRVCTCNYHVHADFYAAYVRKERGVRFPP